jgi:hypothetical protein
MSLPVLRTGVACALVHVTALDVTALGCSASHCHSGRRGQVEDDLRHPGRPHPEDLPLRRLRRAPGGRVEALIIGEAGIEPGSEGISPGAGAPGLPHSLEASPGGQQDLAVGGCGSDLLVAERCRGEQPPGRGGGRGRSG